MSVMIGGTAAKGFSAGGSRSGSAGSAGIVITFSALQSSPSRNQRHTEPDKSSVEITTPTKPQVASGSWDGRSFSEDLRSEEHTSELQSHLNLVCRLLLDKKKNR